MNKVIEFRISDLESKIYEAKQFLLCNNNSYGKDIVLYVPEFFQEFILRYYHIHFDTLLKTKTLFGMEVINGYENSIVVAHKESVVRGIPVIKISMI